MISHLFRTDHGSKTERELVKVLHEENDAWARLSAETLENFEKSFENENS